MKVNERKIDFAKVTCNCAIMVSVEWSIRNEPDRHQQPNLAITVPRELHYIQSQEDYIDLL